ARAAHEYSASGSHDARAAAARRPARTVTSHASVLLVPGSQSTGCKTLLEFVSVSTLQF
ncbi:jg27134, partial [Pararge aegeria aegeria]